MAKTAELYYKVDVWKIIEEGFDPAHSRESESIFSLANENMGVRGFFDEGGSNDSLRGSYLNGVYDFEPIGKSYRGIIEKTHFMIPSADWLLTTLVLDGEVLDLGKVNFSDFTRELDMRAGTLKRSFIWTTESGKRLRVCFLRFLDMVNKERAYQRVTLEALNFSGKAECSMGVSFDAVHEGHGKCYWQSPKICMEADRLMLQACTVSSEQEVFVGARLDFPGATQIRTGLKSAALSSVISLCQGEKVSIDRRVVVLYNGLSGYELWQKGQDALTETGKVSLEEAGKSQQDFWNDYWNTTDIRVEPSCEDVTGAVEAEQQGIRFCSFQLAQTYNGGSVRHNIGAKGLTGEAYNGHAFWDTESCCLPFYLFSNPSAARDLLMFRYNTLPMAIERAKMLDCKGACYPIATLNGEEACPLWQHASLQLQPSTAVAYGIWHYVHLTGDEAFLWNYGAEILLQIARFLASRVSFSSQIGKYGFYGVMGPDEFHMMVNNNAYTNYMGMRSLGYAAETALRMKEDEPDKYARLREKTGVTLDEIRSWMQIADQMYLPLTEDQLFEQHDGYFMLPHTDINSIPVSEFPLYDHWSYDRIYRTDMIKQPDVLMFLYLYNSSFSEETKRINYEYYQPRTIHESSLSPAIHSILAAELGKMDEAVNFFGYATRLDLDNYNRNTREGLHITSIAMAWANIVYGFAGLRSDADVLEFAPRLPERWKKLNFSIIYRDRLISISMDKDKTIFRLKKGEALPVRVYHQDYLLKQTDLLVPFPEK